MYVDSNALIGLAILAAALVLGGMASTFIIYRAASEARSLAQRSKNGVSNGSH